jgi:hypothetical protein
MAQYVVVNDKKYLISVPATVPSFGLKPAPSTVVTAKEVEKK